jgi:glutathione S-transferase
MITISAFSHVPDVAKGLVRDLRVRWALEEARLSYKVHLLEQGHQNKAEYRALQPFGQVPIFEENGLVLFESGAIVLHIAERSRVLLPEDAAARSRAVQWLIAALNSVEPAVWNVFVIDNLYPNEEWARLRRPSAADFMNRKLDALAGRLSDQPFLDGEHFTAGDLMMATVLRFHWDTSQLDPRLVAYLQRCTSRPAFTRALNAQLADFRSAAA